MLGFGNEEGSMVGFDFCFDRFRFLFSGAF